LGFYNQDNKPISSPQKISHVSTNTISNFSLHTPACKALSRDDIQLSVTMEWGEIFWLLSLSELRKVGG
jgi:hypothetical protein